MSGRYVTLKTLPNNMISADCPVMIVAGGLLKDNAKERILIQLKLENIGQKTIKAIKVCFKTFDTTKNIVDERIEHQYLDLNLKPYEIYTDKTGILLSSPIIRDFSITITDVIFEDGAVWSGEASLWEALPELQSLDDALGSETAKKYKIAVGENAAYLPIKCDCIWRCTCGEINKVNENNCHICNTSQVFQFDNLKDDILDDNYSEASKKAEAERIERERKAEADRIERERKAEEERIAAQKRKKEKHRKVAIILSVFVALIASIFVYISIVIPYKEINNAIELMASEDYDVQSKGRDILEEISEDTALGNSLIYARAEKLFKAERYRMARRLFALSDDYKDSNVKQGECSKVIAEKENEAAYNKAVNLMNAGDFIKAYEAFVKLDGYKDSEDKAYSIYDEFKEEKLKTAKPGDWVIFGSYEQDNDISNGDEEIEWLVLEVKDGRALVISYSGLDCKKYNTTESDVTWETCTLRKWLNNDFINSAFSDDEKEKIPTVTVLPDKNPQYDTNPGNATEDKVFVLSMTEVDKYWDILKEIRGNVTDYAVENGAHEFDNSWWLRTPGMQQNYATISMGSNNLGHRVDMVWFSVSPAMWIEIK